MAVTFRLREILEARQKVDPTLNQSRLAALAGISFATVNRMCMNATERVDLKILNALCDALRVKPGDLFEYKAKRGGKG